jgi:hypothetical protein
MIGNGTDDKSIRPNSCSSKPVPPQPDPGYDATRFIAWIKKRGAVRRLCKCVQKWQPDGLDIELIIKRLGPSNISIFRTSGGEKVVGLIDKVWADQWMTHYGLEVPHHAQPSKTIYSVTERKRKV